MLPGGLGSCVAVPLLVSALLRYSLTAAGILGQGLKVVEMGELLILEQVYNPFHQHN